MTSRVTTQILAHGVGGSTDLPVPLSFALIGAAWALTVTFAVVALAWKTPRFGADKPGRDLPMWVTRAVDTTVLRATASMAAFLFAVWVVVAALFGPRGSDNALPGAFYVLLWVGLVAVSVLMGPVWRVISPVRTLWRLLGKTQWQCFDDARLRRFPSSWGYRPAAFGLLAFVWLELASPDAGSQEAIEAWLLAYTILMLVGAIVFGSRWFARSDPFEVYSMVVSRLAPFRRSTVSGRITAINPMDHLTTLPVRPGTVAVLAVLLGSTAFDSFSQAPVFRNVVDSNAASISVLDEAWAVSLLRTVGLVGFVSVVGVTFWAAAMATGGVKADKRRQLPGELAHSLIPIVVGYVFAHYLSYLVERGQETLVRLADPLGRGWHLFGFDSTDVVYVLSQHPSVLWTIKVSCVVIGHIVAVVAAHDRALRLLPRRHQVSGQLAMMLTMVGYTFTGLYLLFGG